MCSDAADTMGLLDTLLPLCILGNSNCNRNYNVICVYLHACCT